MQTGFSMVVNGWRHIKTTMAAGARAVLPTWILEQKRAARALRRKRRGRYWGFVPSQSLTGQHPTGHCVLAEQSKSRRFLG